MHFRALNIHITSTGERGFVAGYELYHLGQFDITTTLLVGEAHIWRWGQQVLHARVQTPVGVRPFVRDIDARGLETLAARVARVEALHVQIYM